MRFEWEEDKRQTNLKKHGFDFGGIEAVFEGDTLIVLDDRFDYGETRFVTFGIFYGRVVAVTHLHTDDVIRIISVRKATKNEQRRYFEQISN
ncbi:MAG TPA: BrnT family toxin [Pyrinomonadaceae bacterium]|jgi:hypothetical protein